MSDLVERLRDVQQYAINLSDAARATVGQGADEIERMHMPFRAVDDEDWEFVMSVLGDGGRGRFWKAVLTEARAALTSGKQVQGE